MGRNRKLPQDLRLADQARQNLPTHDNGQKWPLFLHGGRSTGAKTVAGKLIAAKAGAAGRTKWIERMKLARELGLINRIPQGPQPGIYKMVVEAREIVATAQKEVETVGQSSLGEDLLRLTGKSLVILEEILDRKKAYKGDQLKFKKLQQETAVAIVNAQMRSD